MGAAATLSSSLLAALAADVARHAPFSQMAPAHVAQFVAGCKQQHHLRGEAVLGPKHAKRVDVAAQQGGVAPAQALQEFVAFAEGAPLIGYHVSFDRRLIERTGRGLGLRKPPRRRPEEAPDFRTQQALAEACRWLVA